MAATARAFRAVSVAGCLLITGCTSSGDVARPRGASTAASPGALPSTSTSTSTSTSSPAPGETPAATPGGSPGLTPTPSPAAARYAFPVQSARARYGRVHHDYPAADIFAPCGTAVVAPTSGRVAEVTTTDTWTSARNDGETRGGLSVTVVGADGVRYYGSHLSALAPAASPGRSVAAGERLGTVGRTGSARGTPCHLHFGISPVCAAGDWWVRRGVVPPYELLRAWQRGDQRSPAPEVSAWRAENGCSASPP